MLRLLLKIWPVLLPILIYLIWIFVIERIIRRIIKMRKAIKTEYEIVGEKSTKPSDSATTTDAKPEEKVGHFSFQNPHFLAVIYSSLIIGILTLIIAAFFSAKNNGIHYEPAKYQNGQIVPPKTY